MEDKDKVENARTGYQVAVNLWVYEGTLIWNKFTAMVYANTIVLATIGLLITNKTEFKFMRSALAGLGLSLCVAWFVIIKRSFDYHDYWISSARNLEGLLEPVETVTRQRSSDTSPRKRPKGMPKVRYVVYFTIVVFGIMYIVSLTQ